MVHVAVPSVFAPAGEFRQGVDEMVRLAREELIPLRGYDEATLPGAVEEIGRAAESMGMRGERLQFRPSSNKILQATNLISYGESVTLDFVAPEEPGDYGFLCTYPTHWLTMNGIMRVVPAR